MPGNTKHQAVARRLSARRGFTLIEVLVAIGIISILLALLLPAVQRAREAARRTQCRNNLHQIGLALQNYHGTHGAFPPGSISHDSSIYGAPRMPPFGGLLPYLDQGPLYDRLVFGSKDWIFKDPLNAAVVSQQIPGLYCPSDGFAGATKDYSSFFRSVERPAIFLNALANYGGIYGRLQRDVVSPGVLATGSGSAGSGKPGWIFGVNRATRMSDVTDGASNTMAYAEVLTGMPQDARGSMWTANAGQVCVFTELGPNSPDPDVLFKYFGRLCNPALENAQSGVPCIEGDDVDPNSNNTSAARSRHAGGVHALLADGSVRFINESIAITTWRNLGSMNDGQSIGDF